MSLFLKKADAEFACKAIEASFHYLVEAGTIEQPHLAIIVLDPVVHYRTPLANISAVALYTHQIGSRDDWKWDYTHYAGEKALLTYNDPLKRSAREIQQISPHMLCNDDTALFGSVNLDGIIVGASGPKPYFDEMIAHWVASGCRALALRNMLAYRQEHPDADNYLIHEPD